MDIAIRNILPEDAPSIVSLSRQFGYDLNVEQAGAFIQLVSNSNTDAAYVAISNTGIKGWVQVSVCTRLESGTFVEITGIVVDEQQRGKGIGKLLVSKAKEYCREKNIKKLKVRCNIKRASAHLFYAGVGFKEVKQQKVFEMEL